MNDLGIGIVIMPTDSLLAIIGTCRTSPTNLFDRNSDGTASGE